MNDDSAPNASPTILIVDDEPEVAEAYSKMLGSDYDLLIATGGEEALEKLDSSVDVVLLDRRMPDLSGDDVLEQIRQRGVDCRVVMVTAVAPDIDVIGMDFDDYLEKPVSGETLKDAIERMLKRDKLDKKLQEAFSLASKMATLEAKMDIEELESSQAYAELESEFAEYRKLFASTDPDNDLYSELSTTKMEALFGDS